MFLGRVGIMAGGLELLFMLFPVDEAEHFGGLGLDEDHLVVQIL